MATQLPRSRWTIFAVLLIAFPLLAILGLGLSLEIGNRSGVCGQYWGDGTNDWEDCIEFGQDAVEDPR